MNGWEKERGSALARPFGFTMVGMLVAFCALLFLAAILGALLSVRRCSDCRENTSRLQLDGLCCSLSRYKMDHGSYPPGTGTVDLSTGTTKPFAPGEVAEADAICRYLGKRAVQPEDIRGVNGLKIVIDRWGNPIRVDVIRDPSNPQNELVRVWSLGPDGKEGPVPFSRAQDRSDPRDRDNLANW